MFTSISKEARTAVLALLILGAVPIPFTVTDVLRHGDGWSNLYFTAGCWLLALLAYVWAKRRYRNANRR